MVDENEMHSILGLENHHDKSLPMVDDKAWLELCEFSQLPSLHCHSSTILAAMCVEIRETMGAAIRQQELMGWSFQAQNFGSYFNHF